jgi:hypothetical protein
MESMDEPLTLSGTELETVLLSIIEDHPNVALLGDYPREEP